MVKSSYKILASFLEIVLTSFSFFPDKKRNKKIKVFISVYFSAYNSWLFNKT